MFSLVLTKACVIEGKGAHRSSLENRAIVRRGIIENMTTVMLEDVKVLHLPTRFITSVSTIHPKTSAEIGLRPTQLVADFAVISWVERGQHMEVRLDIPQIEPERDKGSLILVYRIFSGGRVSAQLE